jgi:glyoxylase I family protein
MARIEHFAIFARDLESLKEFYVSQMGMRVALDNSRGDPAGYFLSDDQGTALEIIARPLDQPGVGQRYVCHIAFWVDDFAVAREALERAGVSFETDTAVNTPSMKTLFFNDPEGNRCQIVWRQRPLGSG